jgi:RNA polymerase sigma factor (TIGR02999 family)
MSACVAAPSSAPPRVWQGGSDPTSRPAADRRSLQPGGSIRMLERRAARVSRAVHRRSVPRCTVPAPRMFAPQTGSTVTELLAKAGAGDASALDDVFPLIYGELRRLAERQLRREPDGHTLSPTALVHEAYVRLTDYRHVEWAGRAHFMAVASTAMRRILVEHARGHRSAKRGGALRRVPIDSVELGTEERSDLLLALDEALDRLQALDRRQAQVVECRFFGGLTEEETAEAIGIGLRTVKRDWAKARSWLHRELYAEPPA